MITIGLKMQLYNGCAAEYKKRHDEIWPELIGLLKKAGVKDYYIFLDEDTHILFSVLKISDQRTFDKLPALAIMQKWWDYMSDIMQTNEDNSPVTKILKEVFYLL
jgi:L-rhamnose mutarotase